MKFRRFEFLILFILVGLVTFAHSQTVLEDLATKIRVGTNEEKRDALFQIRNINIEAAAQIAVAALSDTDEIVRATAAHSVLALTSDEAFRVLLPLISDKKPFVREEAAYALGKTKSALAVEPLIARMKKEKKKEVRGAIAFALGLLGDIRAEEALIRALTKEKNLFIQRASARSLGQIRSGKSVSLLIAILRDAKRHNDVKRESAFALGLIGDISATRVLEENLKAKDNLLAQICAEALKKINHR